MNKYQEALDRLKLQENWQEGNELNIIQELIDKSFPIKPTIIYLSSIRVKIIGYVVCPSCDEQIKEFYGYEGCNFCKQCGQALDWSNDEA